MTRVRLLLVLAVAVASVAVAPAPALAMQKAIWGPVDNLQNGSPAFPTYFDLGVQVYQYQLSWAGTASTRPLNPTDPNDPAYKWPVGPQRAIDRAAPYGIQVALLVRGTPGWANGGQAENVGPTDVNDYANFIRAAREKYPSVNRWMIWGEANRAAQWVSGPTLYSDMLDAAYGALKAPDPADPGDNTVVGGMTFTFGDTPAATWISEMKRSNGARPRFDEYGHNPFARRCPDLAQGPDYLVGGSRDISDLDTLENDLQAAFGTTKPLWLSEFTVSSDHANRALTFYVDRNTQADWLSRAFRIAAHVPEVDGIGWFNLEDQPGPDGLTTGLLDSNDQFKPSYYAYRSAPTTDTGLPGPCVAPSITTPTVVTLNLVAPRRIPLRTLLRKYRFKLTSNVPGAATIRLWANRKTARRTRINRRARHNVLIAQRKILVAPTKQSVTAHLKKKMKKRLRRLLHGKQLRRARGSLILTVQFSDASGNLGHAKGRTQLRPRAPRKHKHKHR